jgi:glucose/arabinose dehydrogenase
MQAGLLLLLSACSASPSGGTTRQAADPPFAISEVATFNAPWAMDFLPGGQFALVTEKPGRIWWVDLTNGRKVPVSGVPKVVLSSQGGLLDVVVSPTFRQDGTIYLTYSEPSASDDGALVLATARLLRTEDGAKLYDPKVIWRDPLGGNGGQFGARIAFAPDGKSLFLSSGERQRFTPAQDLSQPLGKILHLTLDGQPAPGNPWAGKTGASSVNVTDPPDDSESAKSAKGHEVKWPGINRTPAEIWSLGHRNPYGLAFAPDGRLWETEMGPQGGDELNLILPGRNYGWPVVSNGSDYGGGPIPDHAAGDRFEPPKVWWNPSVSPSSLLIYTGSMFPEWKGDALIGALSGQALIHVRISGDRATKADQWDMGHRIRAVDQGPSGEVYLLEDGDGARLLKLTPASGG